MKPNETMRYACDDCQVVFDVAVAPVSEWAEAFDDDGTVDVGEPLCCPFCGANELKTVHDQATRSGP